MANPSKRRGTAFEVAIVDYFRAHNFPWAERRVQGGSNDRGDVSLPGVPIVIEVKNCKAMDLGSWCTEAAREAKTAGVTRWAVAHKRRQHGTADAFVTVPLSFFAELLDDWRGGVSASEAAYLLAQHVAGAADEKAV